MPRHQKVIAYAVTILTVLVVMVSAFTVNADTEPEFYGGTVKTYTNGLTAADCVKIKECFFAQNQMSTILSNINRYTPMLMYQISTANGYQYYCTVLAPNRYGSTTFTIDYVSSTQYRFNGTGAWTKYQWCDGDTAGWTYVGLETETVTVTGVIYYRSSTTASGNTFETNTTHIGTDTITGNAYSRYMAAVAAFANPTQSGTGTEDYNAGYAAGYINGRQEVVNNPGDYNLFTAAEYTANYTAGQNFVQSHPSQFGLYTTQQYNQAYNTGYAEGYNVGLINGDGNVTLDLPGLVTGITSAVGEIWQGFTLSGTTIFGISIAAICGSIILLFVVLWVVKKLK